MCVSVNMGGALLGTGGACLPFYFVTDIGSQCAFLAGVRWDESTSLKPIVRTFETSLL